MAQPSSNATLRLRPSAGVGGTGSHMLFANAAASSSSVSLLELLLDSERLAAAACMPLATLRFACWPGSAAECKSIFL
jgi:hypothetical protein